MKRTTKTVMMALAATVITGSAFAQVDSTKTDSTVVSTDSTQTDKKDDKEKSKEDSTATPTPPQASVAPSVKNNTYVWVATNRELLGNKKIAIEAEKQEA
ncbi:hypothetical protein LL912_25305 [Niabella sp. CC-SYL272]|uniref:hypothetical protein n=1 Tax=Niabella agricola TaxID=2891571 RepID=UPI001F3C5FF8|nr:hypothetical protein [Niabella agricola]MCF3112130.1 hypothetical protein [Niabella agricola]